MDDNFYTITKDKTTATIHLRGNWVIGQADALTKALQKLDSLKSHTLTIEPKDIKHLDTVGASLLLDWIAEQEKKKKTVVLNEFQSKFEILFKRVAAAVALETPKPRRKPNTIITFVVHTGEATVEIGRQLMELINFLGQTMMYFLWTVFNPKRWKLADLARHIEETGVNALPIVFVMSFMISIVLAYQGIYQLRKFGAEIYAIDLSAIAVLREMGVLLTAIMVAGRSGSAFAAEIGVMKVNDEIDALRTLGISPFLVLVLPRMLALIITLPLLTFLADMAGLLGGGFLIMLLLDISWDQYVGRLHQAIVYSTYAVGILKAPVFAVIIALVGCMRGLQVTNSAESVGRMTTKAVVESIFLVIIADAALSILFTRLNV